MSNWVVAKFGGSSVKDAASMLRVSGIVDSNPYIKIVVISATQNTTNHLENVAQAALKKDSALVDKLVDQLNTRHSEMAQELYCSSEVRDRVSEIAKEAKAIAETIANEGEIKKDTMDELYAVGERISSLIMSDLLKLRLPERDVRLLDARSIIKTDADFSRANPLVDEIRANASNLLLPELETNVLFVTQGFIGQTKEKDQVEKTTTLGREGSDYSAALFGEAIDASLVQIWTDVEGVASIDPRLGQEAQYIKELSYDEATSLASLGAKVLFPATLAPTKRKSIPVFVGSSLRPEAGGTIITSKEDADFKLKAVSLLVEPNEKILSFVGSAVDQKANLEEGIASELKELNLEFKSKSKNAVSFTLAFGVDPKQALIVAHSLLIQKYN